MRRRRTTTQVLEGLHGDALARLVAKYQRVPWLDRGRGWEGVDCWGLVRLFYLEELGIELPSYAEGYVSAVEREQVSRLIRGQLDEWQRTTQPSFADVAVAWTKREEILSHVGLYVGDGLVLSAQPDALPIAEEVQRTWWSSHLEGYYRYPIAAARIAQPSTRLLPARLSARQHGGSLGDRPIYVTVSDHPLSMRLRSREVPAGGTVEDILVELGLDPGFGPVRVIHGETVIEAPNWRRLRPKGGTVLVVRPLAGFPIIPFLIIAAQAIASAAAGFASGALAALGATSAAGSIGAGIGGGFVGAFNVGAFFGAAFVKIAVLSAVSFGLQQATKSIAAPSGSSGPEPATSPSASRVGFGANETRRYDPIPVGYGRYRRVPDEYALPFTEVAGKERYVRRMLMNGQGRYRVTDVRVNDRPIEDIDGATWHVVEGGVAASYEAEILDAEPDQDAPRHWWRLNGNANDRMTPALDLAASGVVWSSGLVADDADQCAQIGAGDSIGSTTS
ncbi:MAG TPA: NlpC/P60 family protein, partial [Gaiellaceae bacterium]|nr:NlpC/P60 family protein [Gaiellaceae bacterium]